MVKMEINMEVKMENNSMEGLSDIVCWALTGNGGATRNMLCACTCGYNYTKDDTIQVLGQLIGQGAVVTRQRPGQTNPFYLLHWSAFKERQDKTMLYDENIVRLEGCFRGCDTATFSVEECMHMSNSDYNTTACMLLELAHAGVITAKDNDHWTAVTPH